MKRDDDYFSVEPPAELTQKIMVSAEAELTRLRRRRLLTWLMPAAAAAAGLAGWFGLVVTRRQEPEEPALSGDLLLVAEVEPELLEEMDWLEDLETLEKWQNN